MLALMLYILVDIARSYVELFMTVAVWSMILSPLVIIPMATKRMTGGEIAFLFGLIFVVLFIINVIFNPYMTFDPPPQGTIPSWER